MVQKTDRFITLRVYRPEYNELEAIKRQLAAQKGNPMSFAFVIREILKVYKEAQAKGSR